MSDLVASAYPHRATAQEVTANAVRAQQSHELELDDAQQEEQLAEALAAAGGR